MRYKFWEFIHDWLERSWHWVYRNKLSKPIPGERTFQCGSGNMGTLYWSKGDDFEKFPEMHEATPEQMQYFRQNADGSYTNIGGNIDIGQDGPRMYLYRCDNCGKNWSQEKPFNCESCVYCGSRNTVML